MSESATMFIGLDVHNDSIAVAYVFNDPLDEVAYLGPIGTRQCVIDNPVRKMQLKAHRLVFADTAASYSCRARDTFLGGFSPPPTRPLGALLHTACPSCPPPASTNP